MRVLNTIVMGASREVTIPARWHADYGTFTGPGRCDNGLIMWMPVLETSRPDTNGMMVARGSHRDHTEYIRNGTWDKHQASTSGHVELMRFWRHLGENRGVLAPTLSVGDVLVFSKVIILFPKYLSSKNVQCTVHSASGDNSRRRPRQAWQLRFVTDPQSAEKAIKKQYPGKRSDDRQLQGLGTSGQGTPG